MKSKVAFAVYVLVLVGILCFLYAYLIEPYWLEINTVDIFTGKLRKTSLKIVQISDLHCDPKVRNENRLAGIINPMEPDIIVFTGDAVNTLRALPLFRDALKPLKAKIGKYGVNGNIDAWFWPEADLFSGTGFRQLRNESLQIEKEGEVFFVSGLNYEDMDYYHKVLEGLPDTHYSILLYHTPDLIEDLSGINVDLYLAGHTHGGQIAIPFYGAIITLSKYGKRYESGKYVVGDTLLYVNRGIGLEGGIVPRIRFFARPEITVFNIRPKTSEE